MINIVLAAVFLFVSASASAVDRPADFAHRLPIEAGANAGLQRIDLPVEVIAASRSASYADIRVFNRDGQAVPQALSSRAAMPATIKQTQRFIAYPIVGRAPIAASSGVQLIIDDSGGRPIVRIDPANAAASSQAANASNGADPVGALIDIRPLNDRLIEVELDADIPIGRPVRIDIAASADLKTWRTLAEQTPVFRFAGNDAPARMNIPLAAFGGELVHGEYLRLSWPTGDRVALRAVQITTASTATPQQLAASLPPPISATNTALVWTVPFAAPVEALTIQFDRPNTLVPVRLQTRNQTGEPWRPIGNGVVYRLTTNGRESITDSVPLQPQALRQLRLESDDPAVNLQQLKPRLTALLAPVGLVFVTSGAGPYTLAVGKVQADNSALPVSALIPGYQPGAENDLPRAHLAAADLPALAQANAAVAVLGFSIRAAILWGALLLGVLLLSGIVWSLIRHARRETTT